MIDDKLSKKLNKLVQIAPQLRSLGDEIREKRAKLAELEAERDALLKQIEELDDQLGRDDGVVG